MFFQLGLIRSFPSTMAPSPPLPPPPLPPRPRLTPCRSPRRSPARTGPANVFAPPVLPSHSRSPRALSSPSQPNLVLAATQTLPSSAPAATSSASRDVFRVPRRRGSSLGGVGHPVPRGGRHRTLRWCGGRTSRRLVSLRRRLLPGEPSRCRGVLPSAWGTRVVTSRLRETRVAAPWRRVGSAVPPISFGARFSRLRLGAGSC